MEQLGLHEASEINRAQFFLSCAQLSVSGGENIKKPTNLVSFPGAYKPTDPGILIDLKNSETYTPPGPKVFEC